MFEDKKYFLLIAQAHSKGLGVHHISHVIGEDDFFINLETLDATNKVYHFITKNFALELKCELNLGNGVKELEVDEGTWVKKYKVKEITQSYQGTRKIGLGDSLKWVDDRFLNFI